MDYGKMIERAVKSRGFSIKSWDQDEDYPERPAANLGRFRVLDDDEQRGFFSGTEGVISANVVGAAVYRNERVAFYYTEDGMDEMTGEVNDFDIFEQI